MVRRFRMAHEQVGAAVAAALAAGHDLANLSLASLQEIRSLIEQGVFSQLISPARSLVGCNEQEKKDSLIVRDLPARVRIESHQSHHEANPRVRK